jgi:hypothetical protein
MNEVFRQHVEALHPALDRLVADIAFRVTEIPGRTVPQRGIYLFTEAGRHLYVGRSDNMRERICQHSRPGSPQSQASFAFKLAREVCGVLKASYKPEGSRAHLLTQETFRTAFLAQKARVRLMDIRVVEETDANRQALLEMYASIALDAPYNDFNTT